MLKLNHLNRPEGSLSSATTAPLVALLTLALLGASALSADGAAAASKRPASSVAITGARELPMKLPGAAGVAATSRWLIGVTEPLSSADARSLGGHTVLGGKVLVVPRAAARSAARSLSASGRLLYAEPNPRISRESAFESARNGWARGAVVASELTPPSLGSATIAVIDDFVDPTHPELAGHVTYLNTGTIAGPHGTAVASVAAAADGNGGTIGIFPGVQILSIQPSSLYCDDVAEAVSSVPYETDVINLSLGMTADCFTLFIPIQVAYGGGSVVVASAGNEFEDGNPIMYPAGWPHVLSVAALDTNLRSADFSSVNAAVDITAPGVSIPVAVPLALDVEDGRQDGYSLADGTSFSAPMVAGAAAWIRTARRDLSHGQVADVLRSSAIDLGPQGWDADNGWGLLNVAGALAARTLVDDGQEPNDLIAEVSGRLFEDPDEFIWRGVGRASFAASVDLVEDPVDIYRVQIPRRGTAKIAITPSSGDADLEVYDGSATYVGQRSKLLASSRRSGRNTDRVSIRNSARKAKTAYVVVRPYTKTYVDARYRLTVSR